MPTIIDSRPTKCTEILEKQNLGSGKKKEKKTKQMEENQQTE